ncbi:MAG TPA: hypothetical protein VGG32_08530 [Thermoplasmata archaeon]|jgi:excinuclease UvrABC nuclease subunit
MTDTTTPDVSATLPAGTTHYHAVKATELFAKFAAAMRDAATQTAAERAHKERDRVEATTYHRETEQPSGEV